MEPYFQSRHYETSNLHIILYRGFYSFPFIIYLSLKIHQSMKKNLKIFFNQHSNYIPAILLLNLILAEFKPGFRLYSTYELLL